MNEKLLQKIDQKKTLHQQEIEPRRTSASITLELGSLAMRFARIERTPRYQDGERENDAEHSYMLALVAPELADNLYPGLMDLGLISQYAIAHDLIELKTGDVATFHIDESCLAQKEQSEQAALESLLATLPPHTQKIVAAYEAQHDRESRFVRAVDKNLPVITDIYGAGKRVMNEDYGVHTSKNLHDAYENLRTRMNNRFSEFTAVVSDYELLSELFEIEFATAQQK